MGWIKERILSEHRKFSDKPGMDWALIAELKILNQFKEKLSYLDDNSICYETTDLYKDVKELIDSESVQEASP